MRLILICLVSFFVSISNKQIEKSLITGKWQSDTIQDVSVKLLFLEEEKGMAEWSNGATYNFTYIVKKNRLKTIGGNSNSWHKIIQLDKETLILRPIKKNQETVEMIDEFKFKRIN